MRDGARSVFGESKNLTRTTLASVVSKINDRVGVHPVQESRSVIPPEEALSEFVLVHFHPLQFEDGD
jgi:hypothetical protein